MSEDIFQFGKVNCFQFKRLKDHIKIAAGRLDPNPPHTLFHPFLRVEKGGEREREREQRDIKSANFGA